MAVLGIIGIFVVILILFAIAFSANNDGTQIIAILLWVALVLWLVIGKPAFWEGHKALKIIGEILCALIAIGMLPKDKKEDDEKKDEK